jgi:UDP-N-acetyl-D-mannosaminuronic acid transferase (WecB/TagA/CpsF family)
VDSGSKEHLYDVAVTGERWVAVGNKGALVSGGFGGAPCTRIPGVDLGIAWTTHVLPVGDRMYLAGAAPGVIENGHFAPFH